MSFASIKAALETGAKDCLDTLPIAWENVSFTPPADGGAYATIYLLPATPENPTYGDDFHRDLGILQISLNYPIDGGAGRAYTKADSIADYFSRGTSFVSGGYTVTVSNTPQVGPGMPSGDRYVLPVRVRWFSNIGG